jgi:Tfp pilus assembly protein PilO
MHWAGLGVLATALCGFALALLIDHGRDSSTRRDSSTLKRSQIAALEAALDPMRGLTAEMKVTHDAIGTFYSHRVPTSYSHITSVVGTIAGKSGVQLSQIQYSQGSPGLDLTEISLEVGVRGRYRQIMQFINGVERDQLFFVIRALAFTGEQSGPVSLRIRISTWIRPDEGAEHHSELSMISATVGPDYQNR